MPFTLGAWREDIDQAGAWANITALNDAHLNVVGDIIHVPALNKIVALAGMIDTTVAQFARLTSPSLRRRSALNVAPLNGQAAAAQVMNPAGHNVVDLRTNPVELVVGENLICETFANPAAVQDQTMLVCFADGPITPVTGAIFTVHGVSATAAVANIWTNVPIVLDADLARGKYQLVGMRAQSATMVAARVVGPANIWRPGCPGATLVADQASKIFRYGNMGVWGEFEDTDAGTIDILCNAADAAQEFYFDLIQIREGA